MTRPLQVLAMRLSAGTTHAVLNHFTEGHLHREYRGYRVAGRHLSHVREMLGEPLSNLQAVRGYDDYRPLFTAGRRLFHRLKEKFGYVSVVIRATVEAVAKLSRTAKSKQADFG
jgi:hypothetical protein